MRDEPIEKIRTIPRRSIGGVCLREKGIASVSQHSCETGCVFRVNVYRNFD